METTTSDNQPTPQINGQDSLPTFKIPNNDDLFLELHSLRQSYETLRSKSSLMEETLHVIQKQRDDAIDCNSYLKLAVSEITDQRDLFREQIHEFEVSSKQREEEFEKKIDEEFSTRESLQREVEFARERIETLELETNEAKGKTEFLLKIMDSIRPVNDCLVGIIECLEEENVIEKVYNEEDNYELELDNESNPIWEEIKPITRLASEAKSKVNEFKEKKKNEKRELQNSIVSLTEENRDINSLLRVALMEKEAVEKNLNKLKENSEQKRVALLQIAERGLQKVRFGFMMGSGSTEQSAENSVASTTTSIKSDSSEGEEQVVSLASTVERIMKNLRLEITQLRRSLEESRSDNERLQNLTEKQTQEIAENTLYIKELEERERLLVQNSEELLMEIKETEAEVTRWREACELEVEAGKTEIEERDKLVSILKQELERTKAALVTSNGKLQLKEELAATAMKAQAAAEKSLQLADTRAAQLQERIEELRKQLEEAENRELSRRKVRHLCWPWRSLKMISFNNANERTQNVKRKLPEMQSLLHYSV